MSLLEVCVCPLGVGPAVESSSQWGCFHRDHGPGPVGSYQDPRLQQQPGICLLSCSVCYNTGLCAITKSGITAVLTSNKTFRAQSDNPARWTTSPKVRSVTTNYFAIWLFSSYIWSQSEVLPANRYTKSVDYQFFFESSTGLLLVCMSFCHCHLRARICTFNTAYT